MLIVLEDKHKQDLAFLAEVDTAVLEQFCTITLDFIKSSQQNKKLFAAAARKLQVKAEVVENAILALCYLLTEAAKVNLSEIDFVDSLLVLGYSDEHNAVLKQAYLTRKDEIRSVLGNMAFQLPHYVDADWRLDVQVASRTLRDQVQPVFILNILTEQDDQIKNNILQMDYTNLKHLHSELETALDELKTAYSRRIGRNI